MAGGLEIGTPSLASSSAFLAMAGVCVFLSLYFYRKSRTVKVLFKGATASIYDKTFSVFNMISEHRGTHHSLLFFMFFSPLSAVIYAFICVFMVFLPLIYAGLVFWPVVAILCLSLMMIEEAVGVRETANAFETASKKAEGFASGDLRVLSILKKVTPRLSIYYFLLALLFVGCFLLLPYAFSTLLLSWAYFAGLISGNASAAAIPLAIVSTTLSIAVVMVMLFILGRKLKARVFGFPPSDHLTSALSGDIRRRLVYEKMQEVLESDPDEATW